MIRIILALVLLLALPASISAHSGDERVRWSGAVELPDGSRLDFTVELAQDSGTISIPVQGVKDMPLAAVSVTDKALNFSLKSVGAAWDMRIAGDGNSAVGVLRQGGQFKTTMKRLAPGEEPVTSLKRPQEPKAPFPYETIEVSFENKAAGATLAGTLSVPRGTGPFPCVLMVTGSGPQDRDEALMGHRPFLVIADHLTRNGIAVLRYDDRGVGKSTGKFAGSTTDDFAEDALAGVEYLKTRKEVDAKKIGIVGHSEGGVIAPMCAARSRDVAFIVLLAGTGMSGAELLPIQLKLVSIAGGTPAAEAEAKAKDMAEVYALMVAGKSEAEVTALIRAQALARLESAPKNKDAPHAKLEAQADKTAREQGAELFKPWFKRFIALDPCQNLAQVKCPVLAVNGERDLQVPPKENLPRIEKALKDSGNKDVTIIEFPALNHLFQTCKTGSPNEYGTIEETFSPVALEAVTGWIRKRTGLD